MNKNETLNHREQSIQDYPVSHSMDTTWFAVDNEGNLALFSSGEGGAVPNSNQKVLETARIDYLSKLLLEIAKNYDNRIIKSKIPEQIIAKNLSLKKLKNAINEAVQSADQIIGTAYGPERGMSRPITLPSL
ncbi:MAG: hypothetical protein AB4062_21330 [Crocosphaera sp.]